MSQDPAGDLTALPSELGTARMVNTLAAHFRIRPCHLSINYMQSFSCFFQILEDINAWGPAIFRIHEISGNRPLTTVVYTILQVSTLCLGTFTQIYRYDDTLKAFSILCINWYIKFRIVQSVTFEYYSPDLVIDLDNRSFCLCVTSARQAYLLLKYLHMFTCTSSEWPRRCNFHFLLILHKLCVIKPYLDDLINSPIKFILNEILFVNVYRSPLERRFTFCLFA